MATINDEAENNWLADFIKGAYGRDGKWNLAWIGLYRDNAASTDWHDFKWVGGEPVTYFATNSNKYPLNIWIKDPGKYAYLHGAHHYVARSWYWDVNQNDDDAAKPLGIIER